MPPLIAGLLEARAYMHAGAAPRLIETHISWVILAGDYAYKIKKPLDLGFLDFSSLEKRRHYCEEELRLNSRLAQDIYLAVVPITGSLDAPHMEGPGAALEWAVKMRAFPADATLDREAAISREQIDAISDRIAAFHAGIARAPAASAYGTAQAVSEPVQANFELLRTLLPEHLSAARNQSVQALLDRLHAWSRRSGERLAEHFAARKADGYVRECHGDLHLGNIAWVDGQPIIFDALEFNPALRHIDVISEIAFLSMDLQHRGRPDLAWRLLNRYLEQNLDIAGIKALAYYQVYRAMVRAKVAAILAAEQTPDAATDAEADFDACFAYLNLADRLAHDARPALVLMHGVSGSGKTWLSQHLLEQLGGIRLRSDVIRKALFGLQPLQDSAAIPGGIYTPEAGARTLAALLAHARTLLAAGYLVIVDATFIQRDWRAPFQALAEAMGVAWQIVALDAPADLLQARIAQRRQHGADASEAGPDVLESQLAHSEPFTAQESPHVLRLGSDWKAADAVIRLRAALTHPQP